MPPAVEHHQPERLALPGERHARQHRHEPRVAEPVVDPAGAEHGVLHLGDEAGLALRGGLVAVGQRHLEDGATRADQVGLHADPPFGIVVAERPEDLEVASAGRPPGLGGDPSGQELGLGRGERRIRWKIAIPAP